MESIIFALIISDLYMAYKQRIADSMLAAKIDTDRMKSPSFLMILTAAGRFAYRREDGVYVVPAGCLKD